ncbi:MAG: U32 family peptidase, partial [Oscillospiraceae bacterium]
PEYVAAAVNACRRVLDGLDYDAEALKQVFSRGGFTDGYLTSKRGLDMFGYRTKDDVEGFGKISGSLGELVRNEFQS